VTKYFPRKKNFFFKHDLCCQGNRKLHEVSSVIFTWPIRFRKIPARDFNKGVGVTFDLSCVFVEERRFSFSLAWLWRTFVACSLQDVQGMEQWIVRLLQWYSTMSNDVLRPVLYVWQDGRGGWRWLPHVRYNNLRPLSKPVVCYANPRQDPWTERNRWLLC